MHPLLELLDEGRPAGVVLASQDEARLLEWRLGASCRRALTEADAIAALPRW